MKILDNRLEFTGLIREHAWGKVHLAKDVDLSRSVVILEINRHVFPQDNEVRQYVRIAFGLSQLADPNLQQVLGVKMGEDGTPYIILEHVGGTTLERVAQASVNIGSPVEVSYLLLAQIAHGLAAAHDAKDRQTAQPLRLYHLALNTENIRLTESGAVRLANFQIPPSLVREPDQVAYLAPEQIQGGQADHRADMFTLGVIAYELFTGRRLFSSNNVSELMSGILHGEYDLTLLKSSNADPRIVSLIEICIRLNRNDRLVSAIQMADRADALVRESDTHPEKRLRELVEKSIEIPKLEHYPAGKKERVRTRAVNRTDLDEGTQGMAEQSRNDRDDNRRPRAGQETRISSTPVAEKLKRAKRSGLGGNKTILALGIVAAVLVLVVAGLIISRFMQNAGSEDVPSVTTSDENKNGNLSTVPDGVAVYSADSLLGYTPMALSMPEGELLTLKHPCCPDSSVVLNYERLGQGPYVMSTVVEITSNPVGAKLTLNGQDIGSTTPYSFAASAKDTINFTLEIPGKNAVSSGPVALADFATLDIKNISASRRTQGGIVFAGSFVDRPMTSIVTVPAGATVVVSSTNVELGTTPLKLDLGDDPVMLKISKAGLEDKMLDVPAFAKRKVSYKEYLFRRVDVSAHEDGNTGKSINAKLLDMTYDGKTASLSGTTPASVRLPAIDCSITVTADGYEEAHSIVPASATEFAVSLKKKEAKAPKVETAPKEDNTGKAEVRIFVVDDKKSPVPGALIIAEFKLGKEKQLRDLGRTDSDGRVVAKLDPAKYKFMASHDNYKDNDESKEVKAGEQYVLTIKVKRR